MSIDTSQIMSMRRNYTAQCTIITDQDNNQITAFHPGAMSVAHRAAVPTQRAARRPGASASSRPTAATAMGEHARADARAGASRSSSTRASNCRSSTAPSTARCSAWRAGWRSTTTRRACCASAPAESLHDISHAAQHRRHRRHAWPIKAARSGSAACARRWPALRPTPSSTRRAAAMRFAPVLLYGLERGWPLTRAATLGNRLGALKIAHRGGQNHRFSPADMLK